MRNTKCTSCKQEFHSFEIENWKENKFPCPYCGILYSNSPDGERQLRILQDELFIENISFSQRDKILSKMYVLLLGYAKHIHLKSFSNSKYDPDLVELYCHNSAREVIEMFLRKEGFNISKSFGGYLKDKLTHYIYTDRETTGYIRVENEIEDKNGKELQENERKEFTYNDTFKYLTSTNIDEIVSSIDSCLIDEAISKKENYLYMIILKNIVQGDLSEPQSYISTFGIGSLDKWNIFISRIKKQIKRGMEIE